VEGEIVFSRIPTSQCRPSEQTQEVHGIHSPAPRDSMFAIGWENNVPWKKRGRSAYLRSFLAQERRPQTELTLSLKRDCFRVNPADHDHVPQKLGAVNRLRVQRERRLRLVGPVLSEKRKRWAGHELCPLASESRRWTSSRAALAGVRDPSPAASSMPVTAGPIFAIRSVTSSAPRSWPSEETWICLPAF